MPSASAMAMPLLASFARTPMLGASPIRLLASMISSSSAKRSMMMSAVMPAIALPRASVTVETKRVLWTAAIVLGTAVFALKAIAAYITGSVALFSDALESIVNLVTAIVALVAVRLAAKPADAALPYGYHKAEYFSVVLEGVLIALGVHGVKAASRPVINAATAGIGAPVASAAEDVTSVLVSLAAILEQLVRLEHGRRADTPARTHAAHRRQPVTRPQDASTDAARELFRQLVISGHALVALPICDLRRQHQLLLPARLLSTVSTLLCLSLPQPGPTFHTLCGTHRP